MKSTTRALLATAAVVMTGALGFTQLAQAEGGKRGWQQAHSEYGEYGRGWGKHEGRRHGKRHGKRHGRRYGKHHGRRGGRDGGGRFEHMLEKFDTDKDGKLTQAEIDAVQANRIAQYDTDKDGSLSLQEFEQLWVDKKRERLVRGFQRLDADGNATVTIEEFTKRTAGLVERMDRNGDGAVSRDDRGGKKRKWRNRRDRSEEAAPMPDTPEQQ